MASEPDFAVQGTDLPKGAGKQLQEGYAQAASVEAFRTAPVNQGVVPTIYSDSGGDEYDQELLAPTNFPDRPLTHGAEFGPGADFLPSPRENDSDFMVRIATRMLQQSYLPDDAKVWAARVLAGE
jgi:hypothetical protein